MDEPVRIPLWLPPNDGPTTSQPAMVYPRYAGFWRRFVATLVDGVILWIVVWIATFALQDVLPISMDEGVSADDLWRRFVISIVTQLAVSLVIGWAYCAGFESSPWQATPGKRLLRVAVTDLAGGRITFARATGRYVAESLSSALFLIGYLVQLFTEKRQALHDVLAGTLVVRV
jgi:uncharacterized RDD family membrane protein YckC